MTKSNYSDDKNPWSKSIQNGWMVNEQYDAWRSGYLVGERDKADELAFSVLEISCFRDLLSSPRGSYMWTADRMEALKSLKKKVLGE